VRIYPATIAAQLRTALHNGDATTLAALYHPDVRFAPLDPAGPTASGSAEALAWYRDRRERGFRTVVEELFAYPGSVVLGLRLSHPEPSTDHPTLLYRLFRLGHDQIVEIRDFTDRSRALSAAETPFPWTP
jgi:hypothetical protein